MTAGDVLAGHCGVLLEFLISNKRAKLFLAKVVGNEAEEVSDIGLVPQGRFCRGRASVRNHHVDDRQRGRLCVDMQIQKRETDPWSWTANKVLNNELGALKTGDGTATGSFMM